MLKADTVTTREELLQIHELNKQNMKYQLSTEEKAEQGFLSWLYSVELLEKMHRMAPSIIVKDGNKIAGYALTTLKEARVFHPELDQMFNNLEEIEYKGRPLSSFHFYCMGQICVAKDYRGKGVVNLLYQKHKEVYAKSFDFILTEISTKNHRSLKAHQKIGFVTIHTYTDAMDEWDAVVWDWN